MFAFNLNGQITKTKFFVQYNSNCDLFQCKLIVDEGFATEQKFSRLVIGSQYSVVVKSGLEIKIENFHNPKISESNKAQNWMIGTTRIAPTAQPQSDFYSITNGITPASFLGNVQRGDTILLFDIKVTAGDYSPMDVRAFDTGIDPDKTAPGMGSQNYNCSFNILSSGDTYIGNMPSNYYLQTEINEYCSQECVTISPLKNGLVEPVEVRWGDGVSRDTREFCPSQDTAISVTVIDGNNTTYVKKYILHFTDFQIKDIINICPNDSVMLPQLTMSGNWVAMDKTIADMKQFSNLIVAKKLGTCQFVYSDCNNSCVNAKTIMVNVLAENDPNCLSTSTIDDDFFSFNYYPNPAQNSINLRSSERSTVALLDNLGRAIYQDVEMDATLELSIDHISPGMYYLVVKDVKGQKVYPVVKN